ncbi:MAG: methylmalonyl-CoA mutase family protein [Bacteroidota bacterium]
MNSDKNETQLFGEFPPVSTQAWEEKINADLKGADYEKKLIWKALEGFSVKPYYRNEDLGHLTHLSAEPGTAPFVRGNKPANNDWEIRQDFDETDSKVASHLMKEAIKNNVKGIGINLKGIKSTDQLAPLLDNVNLNQQSIHVTSSHSYPESIDLLKKYCADKKVDPTQVNGSFNFDSLSYTMLHGDNYTTQEDNYLEAAHFVKQTAQAFPKMRTIAVNGHYFTEAGSTIVQELAFSLAMGNEYLIQLTAKGLSANEVASKIHFHLGIGPNFFFEIAKLRAARWLWAVITEKHNVTESEAQKMQIHSSTLHWNKTLFDPHVNMLRITTEAMSAALGGTDSMTTNPFDIIYQKPNDFSYRIARNVQHLLKHESFISQVADPSGGSYYIENLTALVAKAAWDLFVAIEHKGGFSEALKQGMIQESIEKTARQRDMDIATRKQIFLGTNQYPNAKEKMQDKIHAGYTPLQFSVSPKAVVKPLKLYRGAKAFEEMRLATETNGKVPKVFLYTFGNLAMRKARSMFISNFFGCAAYETIENTEPSDILKGIEKVVASKADIVVLCSSDDEYATPGMEIISKLKEKNIHHIVVAGNPANADDLKTAGVTDFIHVRTNVLETLLRYQKQLGVMKENADVKL